MVTIEHDRQKIECADAQEARKALAKIKRQEAKASIEHNAKVKAASLDASNSLARLVQGACGVLDEGSTRYFKVWRMGEPLPSGTSYNPFAHTIVGVDELTGKINLRLETHGGVGTNSLLGYRVSAMIEDNAGFVLGLKLADRDSTEEYWVAVGTCDGYATWEQIPERIGNMIEEASAKRQAAEVNV